MTCSRTPSSGTATSTWRTACTARAKIDLVEQLGAEVVGVAFVVELTFLNGRDKLYGHDVHSLIQYESE